ncbi:MAG: 2-C-methyl-D-erythritol 2,4-cyclodiphosphate synthase [Dehalococcoidales bacterium]|nr:MAG: 2-C-methyl-D-erythritol 2,4-cyclodiphosphate synthase [Dehalococcoidales bacterium]
MQNRTRVGIGFDAHPLVTGRRLVLGGTDIPFEKGLSGWSDADALTHAIIDALLGAAGLGDIGSHFPPDEPSLKDISSLILLERINARLKENDWRVSYIDATVVTEQPRLIDHIDRMRHQLAQTLGVDKGQVSVKASTANGLGVIGEGEGIAAYAVAMIERENSK